MSSQLVDTDRRRLRVTRVEVLKNRNQARQPAKKTPPLTSRRQLRVELPHFHNEIFPDSPAPTLQGFQRPSSLNNFLRHHDRNHDWNLDSRATAGRRRLRTTHVSVLDPMIPDVSPPRHLSPDVDTSPQNYLLCWLSFFARAMKPLRRKVLVGVLALLGYSVVWLCGPDTSRLRNDPASRWASIQQSYLKGKQVYWNNPAGVLWVWFKVETGLMDNEP